MVESYTNRQQQQQLDMNSTFQPIKEPERDSTIEAICISAERPSNLSLKETIVELEKPIYVPYENPEEDHDEENPKSKETDVGDEYDKNCYELNDKPITEVKVTCGEGSDDDDDDDDDKEDGDGPWRQQYPDFSVWPDSMLSKAIYNMCNAVTKHNLWRWMRDEDPPADEGYSWWRHPNIRKIDSDDAVNRDGHSGCSFACSMRGVQFIAKHGYETWASVVTKSQ